MPRDDSFLPDDDDALDDPVSVAVFTDITYWLEDAQRAINRIPLPSEDVPPHFEIIYEEWSNISSDIRRRLAILRGMPDVNDAEQLPRGVIKVRQSRKKKDGPRPHKRSRKNSMDKDDGPAAGPQSDGDELDDDGDGDNGVDGDKDLLDDHDDDDDDDDQGTGSKRKRKHTNEKKWPIEAVMPQAKAIVDAARKLPPLGVKEAIAFYGPQPKDARQSAQKAIIMAITNAVRGVEYHAPYVWEKALHSRMMKHKLDVQDIPSESKKLLKIDNVSDRIAVREGILSRSEKTVLMNNFGLKLMYDMEAIDHQTDWEQLPLYSRHDEYAKIFAHLKDPHRPPPSREEALAFCEEHPAAYKSWKTAKTRLNTGRMRIQKCFQAFGPSILMVPQFNSITMKHHNINKQWAILNAAVQYLEELEPVKGPLLADVAPGSLQMSLVITRVAVGEDARNRLWRFLVHHDVDVSEGRAFERDETSSMKDGAAERARKEYIR